MTQDLHKTPPLPMRRRDLLLAGASSLLGAPSFDAVAQAASAVPAPLASAPRSPYVGINLAGLAYYSPQFPFADLTKTGGGWWSRDANGKEAGKLTLTPSGEPAKLEPDQRAHLAVGWEGTLFATGQYVVRYDGEGEIGFPLSTVRVVSRAPGRIVVEVKENIGQLWVGIERMNAANPVRNVRFFWPGTEATATTQPFNPEFLRRIAPFSTLRFMDWGAVNHSPLVRWADRPKPDDAVYTTERGVPVERMIDLANVLQAEPWFCIPHQADDDYVRQFATMVKTRLDPRRVAWIEYSNEVWNGAFGQAKYAVEKARAMGLPLPAGLGSIFYAERTRQIVAIVDAVFGRAERKRWRAVLAGQAVWTQFGSDALAWKDTAALVDAYSIAPYFHAAEANDPNKVAATLALTPAQVVEQMRANIRGDVKRWVSENAKLAARYKLPLVAYEAGASEGSIGFPGDKQDAVAALFAAAHRLPQMREVYRDYIATWVEAGGGLLNQYYDIGRWSKWGLWGVLEHVTQDPATSPKYQGLLEAIAAHPAKPR